MLLEGGPYQNNLRKPTSTCDYQGWCVCVCVCVGGGGGSELPYQINASSAEKTGYFLFLLGIL